MATPDLETDKAHRYFAVECNNMAWDLIEGPVLGPDDADRLVHFAHASAFHWSHADDALNTFRGETLLVAAYLKVGRSEPAGHHARICQRLLEETKERQTPFDAAMACGLIAASHRLASRPEEASAYADRMARLLDELGSEGERDLIKGLSQLA